MVRYVRNRRSAPVTVWACGWKVKLAARGSLADTIALPEKAFADPDLLGHIDLGVVEEVSEESYRSGLASRTLRPLASGSVVNGPSRRDEGGV